MNLNFNALTSELIKNNAKIAQWSLIPMTILIAWILAQMFWLIYGSVNAPKISTNIPKQMASVKHINSASFNVNHLAQSEIFGKVEQQTTQQVEPVEAEVNNDAPETHLPLVLRGIYASTDKKLSNAIIENSNKEQSIYFVNDSIPGTSQLSLAKVLPDRIILNRGGQFETLKMTEDKAASMIKNTNHRLNKFTKKPRVIDNRKNLRLSNQLKSLHARLQNNPQSLSGMMNASPVMKDGQITGFKVSPGKNPSLFTEAGLRRNDIVTNVNGIELNSVSNGLALKEQLKTATELSIQLTRGQQQISLVYSLNENK